MAVLVELEVVIGAGDRGLGVGDEGVDPAEGLQLAGLAIADDDGAMCADLGPGGVVAGAAVGDQMRVGVQRALRPVAERRAPVVGDRVEAHMLGIAILVELDGGDERRFVLRAAAPFAGPNATEHRVIGEHHVPEQPRAFALGHRFEQLVLDPPSRAVADAEMALERARREVVLVLGDQVDGLEPLCQEQPGGVEQGSGAQRRLLPATTALPVAATLDEKRRVRVPAARGAAEAVGPARTQQRGLARRLRAVLRDEGCQGHAALELNLVLGHRKRSAGGHAAEFAPDSGSGCEPPS